MIDYLNEKFWFKDEKNIYYDNPINYALFTCFNYDLKNLEYDYKNNLGENNLNFAIMSNNNEGFDQILSYSNK